MAKPDLGTKRVCPDTGRKFYDLNKTPVISPYTGKVVPIAAPTPPRARPEPAAAARPAPVVPTETILPETTDAEFVSLEDAEAEQQGKKPAGADATAAAGEEEEVEIGDESMDDAAFIEEQEEGDADVTDIIGESIEKEEET
ncbi:MAG TPA: TIGR02300 family protein [Pseudolabrys sp.]|nr:TIGR02300 family protein [Pseudolabrys sp.]